MAETNRVFQQAESLTSKSRECVETYPMSAAAVSFALGMAAGILIGSMLAEGIPARRHEHVAQRLGRQMLDAMARVLPESLSSRVHS